MDWKKELGILLRESRRDRKLLQDEVAKEAKVHPNMIGRYESGDVAPALDVLIQLAAILDKREFRIGDHLLIIKRADGEVEEKLLSQPKQLRLVYGEEYVFNGRGASMKIQPSRDGLFISQRIRKRAS
jgi:transcriptional regulator with XRE-family HTH domain